MWLMFTVGLLGGALIPAYTRISPSYIMRGFILLPAGEAGVVVVTVVVAAVVTVVVVAVVEIAAAPSMW